MADNTKNLYDLKTGSEKLKEIELALTYIQDVVVSISNLAISGDIISDVHSNLAQINTCSSNILAITTTSTSIDSVNTVNTNIAQIITCANAIANINAVATNIANVNTLAGLSSQITTLASISANITTVAGISADVTAVAGISSDVTAVNAEPLKSAILANNTDPLKTAILNAGTNATNAQLKEWEAEAERLTAESYATEAVDVPVNIVTSDGDGTFTYTPTSPAEYSALHQAVKAGLVIPTPAFPADEGLALVAREAGNDWEKILGLPLETGNKGKSVTNNGVEGDSFWSPVTTNPNVLTADYAIASGTSATVASGFTIADGVTLTIPDGSVLGVV